MCIQDCSKQDSSDLNRCLGYVAVTFGVPASFVDRLIEATQGTSAEALRWVVIDTDISALGLLELQWRNVVDICIVGAPRLDREVEDCVLSILDNESVPRNQCVWIDKGRPSIDVAGFANFVSVEGSNVEDVVEEIQQWRVDRI